MRLTNSFILYVIVFQILISFTNFKTVSGQNSATESLSKLKKQLDKIYGIDYTLVNGIKHVNFYASATGHPFLNDPSFEAGWLKIKENIYTNQVINYDIYNQEIIAEYKSDLIGTQRYIVPDIFLEAFGMGQREFIKLETGEQKERIYELISNEKDSILLTHEKLYSINRNSNSQGFLFSETITKKYILRDGELIRFRNSRSFWKLFSPPLQGEIKSYLKKYRIKMKKADPMMLKQIMNYINTL